MAAFGAWELREVWSHEALDFTTWLEDKAEFIAEDTGLQVSGVERERLPARSASTTKGLELLPLPPVQRAVIRAALEGRVWPSDARR